MEYKYKSYSYILTIAFVLLSVCNMSAQSKFIVTGVVTSSTDGLPVIGATISEKDANNRIINAVIADFDGNYSIGVSSSNAKISYSSIGYSGQEKQVNGAKSINVVLVEASSELDEVVLIAKQKVFTGDFDIEKRRIATAIQTIDMKGVAETVSGGIVDQLQGRLSGVDIIANSGDPGAPMSIRIRGTSSLNSSSEPLIVINGVPFETQSDESFNYSTADQQQYASLIGVSPDDIESISVLKDAAATAQYGSRAANGVLLINTKRGATGKARFNYSFKSTTAWQPTGAPMLNGDQYSTLLKDELLDVQPSVEGANPQISFDPTYELYDLYNQNVDWLKEITQTGHTNEHFFRVSGGGEKATYSISSGYRSQEGTTVGTGLQNFTSRAILDYNISDKFQIASELSYNHTIIQNSFKGVRDIALKKMPNQAIYALDEDGNPTDTYYTPVEAFQGNGGDYYNPIAAANLITNTAEINRITPIFRGTYTPNKTLSFRSIVSFDINVQKENTFNPQAAFGIDWTNTSANAAGYKDDEFLVIRTDNSLTWNPELGDKHSLFTNIKFETYEKTSKTYESKTTNSPSTELQTPFSDARIGPGAGSLNSSFTQFRYISTNLMFNYQFLDRYILSGGVRQEGNSKFGTNSRYGYFPSLAGKWIFSDEKFMEALSDSGVVNELGLRASWGVNGNAPGFNYGAYNTYTTYDYNYLGQRPIYPQNMELTDLKWETVIQKNYGLTFILFDNKISGDFEWYDKETKDLLNKDTYIPSTTGFSEVPYLNLGNIKNKGFELNFRTRIIENSDFSLGFNFNFARNQNIITKITEDQDVEEGNALATGSDGYLKRIQEGNPIGSFYGYKYIGVYSTVEDTYAKDVDGETIYDLNGTPKRMTFNSSREFQSGEAQYEDINNDGTIDRLDVVYIGNANPLLYGGFGPEVRYKNFSFNAFFNFRLDQKVINIARMNTESMINFDNQNTATLRRWRYEGDVTDIPKASFGNPVNTLASDRFLEDASFLRLKYITVRYNLPKEFVKKLNFSQASIYATGNNLLTFTEYSGSDPETGGSSDWTSLGYDTSQTPIAKQVVLGLNISF